MLKSPKLGLFTVDCTPYDTIVNRELSPKRISFTMDVTGNCRIGTIAHRQNGGNDVI